MKLWKSIVGKLWMTIIGLVALVLAILGMFLLQYIDVAFSNSHDVKLLFIYTGIIGFLLTTFFAFFLSTKITEPLLQLIKAVDRISKGDLLTRVRYRSTDELGQLANAFNMMAEKLQETITDLSHEKEQLGSILRSMNDAVITLDAAGRVVLAVEDNGKGLPSDMRDRLTEPYVTTRAKGTGLGLAIVKKIMEDHGGELVLGDRPGGGAVVKLVFSAASTEGWAADAPDSVKAAAHGS